MASVFADTSLRPAFRPDVEGLRALAITVVILFHTDATWARSGFVGVDVFFVISGFLITRQLHSEVLSTGRVDLFAFWGRRVRRLVPSAALVLVSTGVACFAFLPAFDWQTNGVDIVSSSLYVSNVVFSRRASRYFDDDLTVSPFLHSWSLSVEEQFYLAWPLALALLLFLVGPRRTHSLWIAAGLASVAVLSFVGCLWLTARGSSWAFFASPCRAWQFACGGLVAVGTPWLESRTPAMRSWIGWLGTFLTLAGLTFIDPLTEYPGVAALSPTVGASCLIAAGAGGAPWVVHGLLGARPVRWIGRLSYVLYLWHWPLLVFVAIRFPGDKGWPVVAAVGLAFVLAILTHYVLEDRVRFHPTLTSSQTRTFALFALLVLVSGGLAVALHVCSAIALRQPALAELVDASSDVAARDLEGNCASTDVNHLRATCSTGGDGAQGVLLLTGDSHARQWLPALEPFAQAAGLKVVYSGMGACPSLNLAVAKRGTRRPWERCTNWQLSQDAIVDGLRPRLVVMSNMSNYVGRVLGPHGEVISDTAQADRWAQATEARVSALRRRGIPVLAILDTPQLPSHPLRCLATARQSSTCDPSRLSALAPTLRLRAATERGLAGSSNSFWFDPVPLLCDVETCPLRVRGVVAYRDTSHITASLARSLASDLEVALKAALDR